VANFKIGENGADITSFDLPLNRPVSLVQWGGDGQGRPLEVAVTSGAGQVTLEVGPERLPSASTRFTVTGRQKGAEVTLGAFVAGSGRSQRYSRDLTLRVRGMPRSHPGYTVDLLAQLAMRGNARQIRDYATLLQGPYDRRHPLSQDTRGGHFNCGDVAGGYGRRYFGQPTHLPYFTYYRPPASDQMFDLRFDPARVAAGIARIQSMVTRGVTVRLWTVHHDGFARVIQPDWRTHFLTVIGHAPGRFLCLDPWPDGSAMAYDGGMYSFVTHGFLGELVYDPAHLELGIGSPVMRLGLHRYLVIAGP
jgi:hypothetical protein